MSTPEYLPGTQLTQADLTLLLARAPRPYASWFQFLDELHPVGLAEVPIWYVTVVNDALKAGHITAASAKQLLDLVPPSEQVAPPVHLMTAWNELMGALATTWPRRHRAMIRATERMNAAVARARRAALRG